MRKVELCAILPVQESLAPKIKDLDVGKDWVSSRCTVAVKELKAEWSTSQRSQVPGMSAERRATWHWQIPLEQLSSGGIELSAAGR